jgi:hypothetical protein
MCCSCGHVSYAHYRQRSVCRKAFCPCNEFRTSDLPREVGAPSATWVSSTSVGAPVAAATAVSRPVSEPAMAGGA